MNTHKLLLFALICLPMLPAHAERDHKRYARALSECTCELLPCAQQIEDITQETKELTQEIVDVISELEVVITNDDALNLDELLPKCEMTSSLLRELEQVTTNEFEEFCQKVEDGFEQTSSCLEIIKDKTACRDFFLITSAPSTRIISEPGTYCLAEDLAPTQFNGILVSSSNVIINLNDRVIDGTGTPASAGIFIAENANNVQIFNGVITNYTSGTGVNVPLSSGHLLQDIKVDNCQTGFEIESVNSLIKNCIATNNSFNGFAIQGPSNNCYLNCIAKNNTFCGFNLFNQFIGPQPVLLFNCIANNNKDGMCLAQVSDAHIRNCTCNNNEQFGINLTDNKLNYIFNNVALNNGVAGVSDNYNTNVNAHSATQITGPTIITLPGTYVLVNDIAASTDTAITVSASNVILDFNNHTIDGNGQNGIDILPDIENVEIVNGRVRNGVIGINAEGAQHFIHDVHIFGCSNDGFVLTGSHMIVQGCTANTNSDKGFIIEAGSTNCCVLDCVSKNNASNGIAVDSDNHTILNCIVNGNGTGIGGSGIALDNVSNCRVQNCTTNHNGSGGIGWGINDTAGPANNVYGNFAFNNTTANYNNVDLVEAPALMLGRLVNIDA